MIKNAFGKPLPGTHKGKRMKVNNRDFKFFFGSGYVVGYGKFWCWHDKEVINDTPIQGEPNEILECKKCKRRVNIWNN